MQDYKHSVSLDESKCVGCTTCLKRCPTEAIRIRDGKASIRSSKCIMKEFKVTVALPAPALYGQFDGISSADYIIEGLHAVGFDHVFEVACAAEMVSAYTRMYLNRKDIIKPVISSACPVITRMICMNYPYLAENIMPLLPPIEIAAKIARDRAAELHPDVKPSEIGIFFISPCTAKVSYVKNGFAGDKNNIDCVVSVRDTYFKLLDAMKSGEYPAHTSEAGMIGIGWATKKRICP